MSIGISKLAGMPRDHREKLENCVKLLLLWVAASHQDIQKAYENLASIFEVGRVEAMGEAAAVLLALWQIFL